MASPIDHSSEVSRQPPPPPPPPLQSVPPGGWPAPPDWGPPPANTPEWDSPPPVATPSILLTFVITLFFGVFGAIPAAIHYRRAHARGASGKKYWITFAAIMAAWIALIAGLAAAGSGTTTKVMTPSQLDTQLVDSGQWTNGAGISTTATDATCVESAVHGDGTGTYVCLVDFDSGQRQTINVTVGSDGSWVTGP